MNIEINYDLVYMVGAIACFLIGNTICGVAKAFDQYEFDWKKLLRGILKYLLILVSVVFFFIAGLLLPSFEVNIPILETKLTIIKLLETIALAICGRYAYLMWENLKVLFGLNDDDFKPKEITHEK